MITLLAEQHPDVLHQIRVQVHQDAICLSNTVEGHWNQEQQVHLKREHVEAIQHIWETLLTSPRDDFYPIVDILYQELPLFEILTCARIEQTIELYHATIAGVETCNMKIDEFQMFLDWYMAPYQ